MDIRFDDTVKTFGFEQCIIECCVYRLCKDGSVVFLVLHIDDILLSGDNADVLSGIKGWLSEQFKMKEMGDAGYILGINVIRDCMKRACLSQSSYIDIVLARFSM